VPFLAVVTIVAALIPVFPAFASSKTAIPCNIQLGSCTAKTDHGISVEFDIKPKPVTSLSELSFDVRLNRNGDPVTGAAVAIDLTMPEMYMGKNQPVLRQVSNGRFQGKGIIPKCPSGSRTWKANVIIVHDNRRSVAGFVFEVH
jgi:hypothetical protein